MKSRRLVRETTAVQLSILLLALVAQVGVYHSVLRLGVLAALVLALGPCLLLAGLQLFILRMANRIFTGTATGQPVPATRPARLLLHGLAAGLGALVLLATLLPLREAGRHGAATALAATALAQRPLLAVLAGLGVAAGLTLTAARLLRPSTADHGGRGTMIWLGPASISLIAIALIANQVVASGWAERRWAALRASSAAAGQGGQAQQQMRMRIDTQYHLLDVERIAIPMVTRRGALAVVDDLVVIAGQKGRVMQFEPAKGEAPVPTGIEVPLRLDDPRLGKFAPETLSIFGLRVVPVADGLSLYASHLDYDADGNCVQLALSAIPVALTAGARRAIESRGTWRRVFTAAPCIAIDMLDGGALFGTGGRIAIAPPGLLLSVGSFGINGFGSEPMVAQLPEYDYGKVLALPLAGGRRTIFASGLRNTQGLLVLADGTVIGTDHGPRGGDEVNIIVEGGNYGWPRVTYGTAEGIRTWPHEHGAGRAAGRHQGYRKPLIAFSPSVGISQVATVGAASIFPAWRDDLLIASLRAQNLFRLRYEDGAVRVLETIPIGARLRDMVTLSDGTLVVLTDSDMVLVLRNAELAAADRPRAGR